MNAVLRRRSAALLIVPLILILAGCVKFDTAIKISANDQVDVSMLIAVQEQVAGLVGKTCDSKGTNSMSVTPYNEAGYVGCTISGSAPLSQIARSGSTWTLSHENGQYSFLLPNSSTGSDSSSMSAKMFDRFNVAVTFPGEVSSHSGSSTVDGTTVIWTDPDDLLTGEGLSATSKEASPAQAVMGSIGWIVGGVVLVGAVVLILILAARRRAEGSAATSAPEAGPFTGASPQGMPGPGGTGYATAVPAAEPPAPAPAPEWPFTAAPPSTPSEPVEGSAPSEPAVPES